MGPLASALNILKMTEKDWTKLLTENNITMNSTDTETGEKYSRHAEQKEQVQQPTGKYLG